MPTPTQVNILAAMIGAAALVTAGGAAGGVTVSETRLPAFEALEGTVRARFEPVPSVPGVTDAEGSLINGTPIDPAVFPAVFRMTTGGTCTATVVGPAAMLLAAHCVDDLERIAFVAGGRTIAGICEHAPDYRPPLAPSADFALCLLEREVGGFSFESVDIADVPALGATLRLTGYGCTFKGGGLDGFLRIGSSTVVDKPFANWPDEASTIYTRSVADTDENRDDAILCPGDSGGPLFRVAGDARTVVGVNSRTTFQHGVSLFAATGSEAGRAFFNDWTSRHGQKICGVNLATGCR